MKKKIFLLLLICFLATLCNCSSKSTYKSGKKVGGKTPATQRPYVIKNRRYYPIPSAEGYHEKGLASWYGKMFHGRKTANGETYDMYGHTAAHKTLPMNTMLLVKNLSNGKTAVVRINDRGPFVRSRIIDLTYTTAKDLDIIRNGTAKVEIVALAEEEKQSRYKKEQEKTSKQPAKAKQNKQLVHQDFDKGNFYIQVRAFEDKGLARALAQIFAAKGRDVIIQQYPAAGISLYRVMVYSGTSLKQARKYEAYLEQNGFANALVIARDKK